MPFRRRFSRAMIMPRRPHRWLWAAFQINNVAPNGLGTANNDDLLASFRTAFGATINFPDIVIWRIHIKFTARISIVNGQANNGLLVASWVDNVDQSIVVASTKPYAQQFLAFEQMYVSEVQFNAGGTSGSFSLYKNFDIKSHRKLRSPDDTLWWQSTMTGAAGNTYTDYSMVGRVLLKIPT